MHWIIDWMWAVAAPLSWQAPQARLVGFSFHWSSVWRTSQLTMSWGKTTSV